MVGSPWVSRIGVGSPSPRLVNRKLTYRGPVSDEGPVPFTV